MASYGDFYRAGGGPTGGTFGPQQSSALNLTGYLLGQGLQMFGAQQASKAQAGGYIAGARSATFAAEQTKKATTYAENLHRRAAKRFLATVAQQYADAGVTFEGAPTVALAASAKELEMEGLKIRREGLVAAEQYRQNAQDYQALAEAQKKAGKTSMIGGIIQTGLGLAGMFA